MSRKLARRLGLKIDTSKPPSLEGVSTDSKSFGYCYNVSITFTNKTLSQDTDFTLSIDIIITNYDKYALLIGTDWGYQAGAISDWGKLEFKVDNIFVPMSVHRLSSIPNSGANDKTFKKKKI